MIGENGRSRIAYRRVGSTGTLLRIHNIHFDIDKYASMVGVQPMGALRMTPAFRMITPERWVQSIALKFFLVINPSHNRLSFCGLRD
jgi:hypothetical protein